MKNADREKGSWGYQRILWGVLLAFSAGSLALAAFAGNGEAIVLSLVTALLSSVPFLFGRWLGFELNNGIFTFFLLYSAGPILGTFYKLYYLTTWWDSFLHFCGGVAFAMFGWFLLDLLNKGNNRLPASVIFAVCFSVFVSALWEFFEFGCDRILGTDMQMDTVVTDFSSYFFGTEPGTWNSLKGIRDTAVNGQSLGVEGHLDIGLFDTMKDMILETLGAAAFGIYSLFDRGRHPIFKSTKKADVPPED